MGKNPAFQWYPNDYLRDTRILSLPARGAWADMLNYMWYAPERGAITGTHEQISRMLSCSIAEIESVLNELNVTKVADVTNCNGIVTVINRRMHREEKERKSTRLRVQKFRNARNVTPCNENITPPSSTSSSTTKNIYKENSLKILSYLNEKTGKKYRDASQIEARLRNGGSLEGCMKIIDNKLKDPFFIENPKYMNPLTLFRKSHWDKYLNDEPEVKKSSW